MENMVEIMLFSIEGGIRIIKNKTRGIWLTLILLFLFSCGTPCIADPEMKVGVFGAGIFGGFQRVGFPFSYQTPFRTTRSLRHSRFFYHRELQHTSLRHEKCIPSLPLVFP